jgi:hypothetical protein
VKRFLLRIACLLLLGCISEGLAEDPEGRRSPFITRPVADVLAEQKAWESKPMLRAPPGVLPPASSLSLLPYLNYVPAERNQGSCGNCGQWSGTAQMEIMMSVRYGIYNRLSVQFLNTCRAGPDNCCAVGDSTDRVAEFYRNKGYAIPWSNTNAAWINGDSICHLTCADIATNRRYSILDIWNDGIEAWGVPQANAIQNIKSLLDQGRAVGFDIYVPQHVMGQFMNFFYTQSEATLWNPDLYQGQIFSNNACDAHALVCVGYNDTGDPNTAYWVILNSWGAPALRTAGTFRLKMYVDYNSYCIYTNSKPMVGVRQLWWSSLDARFNDQWDDDYDRMSANDTRGDATDFGYNWSKKWLSSIWGPGRQYNDDWYSIKATWGNLRLVATCLFTHAEGDIDMELVSSAGDVLAYSRSTTNYATIDFVVPVFGVYYLRVYGKPNPGKVGRNTGNEYDLWWDDQWADDVCEENDSSGTAHDIAYQQGFWLSEAHAGGFRQFDSDWYRIDVPTNCFKVSVTCTFDNAAGDIDLALYSTNGRLALSSSSRSYESIQYTVPGTGTYFIHVFGYGSSGNRGNPYDLWWNAPYPDDAYEENDLWGDAWYPGYNWDGVWLSAIQGRARKWDTDWYRIEVGPDQLHVTVTCSFTHAEGDLNLSMTDMNGFFINSEGTTDGEAFTCDLPAAGTYYISVYSDESRGTWYDLRWKSGTGGGAPLDDVYEENDTLETAFDLSTNEAAWLSSLSGAARQRDQDWYRIEAAPGNLRIVSTCKFTHAEGDIDLALYNSGGQFAASSGVTDQEVIDCTVPAPGTYYLVAYNANRTNAYDLWWVAQASSTTPNDDAYETNNTLATSYDLRLNAGQWLASIAGPGIQADADWYRIETETANEHIITTCTFVHAEGDIDIRLYDGYETLVAQSLGVTNEEVINFDALDAGSYYLQVNGYPASHSNAYDLWWTHVRPEPTPAPDDNYEENDTFAEADEPGGAWKGNWLSAIDGAGILADDDWYRITVAAGATHVIITCSFTHAEGNIDIALYSSGGRIADSMTSADGEIIDCAVPGPGDYAIAVDGAYATNTYDLWWDTAGTTDDAYEENDTQGAAYYPGHDWANEWLSSISGGGIQWDEDWYRVDVAPGRMLLMITCSFTHAEGDIDMALYDAGGNQLALSAGVGDGEAISHMATSPGAYFVRVYGYIYSGDLGSAYDLQYHSELSDDAYEENDSQMFAWNLGAAGGIWLSSFSGAGIQGDEDWYSFSVLPGHLQISATCRFVHAEGNIDLALYDAGGQLAASQGTADEETINYLAPTSGVYHLRIWGDNQNNSYDLTWDAVQPLTPAVPEIVQFQFMPSSHEQEIVVETEQSRVYLLQGSANPFDPLSWTEQDSGVAVGNETSLYDTNQSRPSVYFYRIEVMPVSPPPSP